MHRPCLHRNNVGVAPQGSVHLQRAPRDRSPARRGVHRMRLRRRHLRGGARRTRRRPRRRRHLPRPDRLRRDRPARARGGPCTTTRCVAPGWAPRCRLVRDAADAGSRCSACASAASSLPRRSAGRWRGRPTPEIGWYDVDTDQPETGARRAVVPVAFRPVDAAARRHRDRQDRELVAGVRARPRAGAAVPPRDRHEPARLVAGRRPRRRSRRRRAQPRRITRSAQPNSPTTSARESAAWCAAS